LFCIQIFKIEIVPSNTREASRSIPPESKKEIVFFQPIDEPDPDYPDRDRTTVFTSRPEVTKMIKERLTTLV